MRASPTGGFSPTPVQEHLLRAALLQGAPAEEAWRLWRTAVDIERLDAGSFRLLPLLYHNLSACGVQDPLMPRLRGIHRMAWVKNQIFLQHLSVLLGAFHAERIRTMALKGAALTVLHYRDHALRPMRDADLLVHPEETPAAIALLRRLNWAPRRPPPAHPSKSWYHTIHSLEFRDAEARECDLHWHVLPECCYPRADADFWDAAVPVTIHGVATRALCPADQLLHACVHGERWNAIPPLRWVADAAVILRSSPGLEWERLLRQTRERQLALPVRESLAYLRRLLDAPVPESVSRELASVPVRRIERMEYRVRTRPPTRLLGFLPEFALRHLAYARTGGRGAVAANLFTLPVALQHQWGAEHLWQLPVYAAQKTFSRMRPRRGDSAG